MGFADTFDPGTGASRGSPVTAGAFALLAIGAGDDAGTTWLVATGLREECLYRGELALNRYGDIGAWFTLPWDLDHMEVVRATDPEVASADRDPRIAALAIVRGDPVVFVPTGTKRAEYGRSLGGTCNCRDRSHSADEGVTLVRVRHAGDGREFICSVVFDAPIPGERTGRILGRAA